MMFRRRRQPDGGRGHEIWPIFGLLLAAVVVSTVCVLWFMGQAMRNESLAVRQQVTEWHRTRLDEAAGRVRRIFSADGAMGAPLAAGGPQEAAEIFEREIRSGKAQGLILYDKDGHRICPLPIAEEPGFESPAWTEAGRIEHQEHDPVSAAKLYAAIAQDSAAVDETAAALLAQARCLIKSGQNGRAIETLTKLTDDPAFAEARNGDGRLMAPNAMLLTLELVRRIGQTAPSANLLEERLRRSLAARIEDYSGPCMPSSQRLMLMARLREMYPDHQEFATEQAEALVQAYLDAATSPPSAGVLCPTPLPEVWQFASADGRSLRLFDARTIYQSIREQLPTDDGEITILAPGRAAEGQPFLITTVGETMPEWRLALMLDEAELFAAAVQRRQASYLWSAILVILVIAALAALIGRHLLRQVRLARLKNDFVATVSHELKTPLASMRLLVDTLLEGRCRDQSQVREYLELLSRENVRLSRLIDNFLTFSRMERNKRTFEFVNVQPAELVEEAAASVKERFEASGHRLEVDVADGLPPVTVDCDAMLTVLLNLLDNACKYSGDGRRIGLRAYADNGQVLFEVSDDGIGMSKRETKRVFERFYQVDQTLSRRAGGCGLGLSIVKFIVDAHSGSIDVRSEPGKGSTFTVRLPSDGQRRHCES